MSRPTLRRRRRPLTPRIEGLEPRQLLTTGTIRVSASDPEVTLTSPGDSMHPIAADFSISASGGIAGQAVWVTWTMSGSAADPADYHISSSGMSILPGSSGNVSVALYGDSTMPPSLDLTMTVSVPSCCPGGGGITWNFAPDHDTITINRPATPVPCLFCEISGLLAGTGGTGPNAVGTGDPAAGGGQNFAGTPAGPGVAGPRATSDAGVAYASGGVSPRSPALLQSAGYGDSPLGVDLGWTNLAGFAGGIGGPAFGSGMTNADLP